MLARRVDLRLGPGAFGEQRDAVWSKQRGCEVQMLRFQPSTSRSGGLQLDGLSDLQGLYVSSANMLQLLFFSDT